MSGIDTRFPHTYEVFMRPFALHSEVPLARHLHRQVGRRTLSQTVRISQRHPIPTLRTPAHVSWLYQIQARRYLPP